MLVLTKPSNHWLISAFSHYSCEPVRITYDNEANFEKIRMHTDAPVCGRSVPLFCKKKLSTFKIWAVLKGTT